MCVCVCVCIKLLRQEVPVCLLSLLIQQRDFRLHIGGHELLRLVLSTA